MIKKEPHSFHIPVMGLSYTVDTPVKVARFGISSVVSIIEDNLLEEMRKFYSNQEKIEYIQIPESDIDHRAKRVTAYLNLIDRIVEKQFNKVKSEPFEQGSEIVRYFELLPANSELKRAYFEMIEEADPAKKKLAQQQLREKMSDGSIDVNIMTKCDRMNYADDGSLLPVEYADAMAALRGFALSSLSSSVVFSAGMNPRLYSYCEQFDDFIPDENGELKKKIILKVSDYRSASIQGKFLAKKGLLVSEFRIESGLNCGGHAFPTEGLLLGPILEEFNAKRNELSRELIALCNEALIKKNKHLVPAAKEIKITVQGGVGTSGEHKFLLEHYKMDSIGWGSPFMLVPEATNVDEETLNKLATAVPDDYYLSYASPLGIPFNNFRKSSAEAQRLERIEKGRPGSACYKKFLSFSNEFTKEPICTSSREYQNLKLKKLQTENLSPELLKMKTDSVMEKDCLCEGLSSSVLLKNNIPVPRDMKAVSVCPGPNLAFFSGIFSLEEMIGHIYGRKNILNSLNRPHMFINELKLYIDYLKREIENPLKEISAVQSKYFASFKKNLLEGIDYYSHLLPDMKLDTEKHMNNFMSALRNFETQIQNIFIPEVVTAG
ncbi:MAG TPA: hypothetical protein VII99_01710 [Bacteroidia bacterium]